MPATKDQQSIRILIAEGQKLARLGIMNFLSDHGHISVVGEAESAGKALEMIAAVQPDVAILDMGLPDMDGVEATRRIKLEQPAVRVVILASNDLEHQVLAALSAGADAYFLKESVSSRLIDVVDSVCQGGAWLDPSVARKVVDLFSDGKLFENIRAGDSDGRGGKQDTLRSLGLTEREGSILALIVGGKNNAEIAQTLHVSYHTVKSDVTSILQKLSVQDRVQAAVKALRDNLV